MSSLPFGEFQQKLSTEKGIAITVSFHRVDASIASEVFRAVSRAEPRANRWGEIVRPVEVRIHPTHASLEAAVGYKNLPWLRAWATDQVIHLQSPRTWGGGDTEERLGELLTHEMTHVVMYQQAGAQGEIAKLQIPIWFLEGMASVTAQQGYRRHQFNYLGEYLNRHTNANLLRPPLKLYREKRDLVYSAAHLAFRYLIESSGDKIVPAILANMRQGKSFDQSFFVVMGERSQTFEDRLQAIFRAGQFSGS